MSKLAPGCGQLAARDIKLLRCMSPLM